MSQKKTIIMSKETHKKLSIKKIKEEYDSFEEMLVEEILDGDTNE